MPDKEPKAIRCVTEVIDGEFTTHSIEYEQEEPAQNTLPMTPTKDQQRALDRAVDWLCEGYNWDRSDPTRTTQKFSAFWAYLIKGYAGTGKSFSITELVKILVKLGLVSPGQILFTAPTNKAVKVLRNYLDGVGLQACPSRTIFSALGLSLQANGEVKELKKPDDPVCLSDFKVIVCDEASMNNSFLMSAIEDAFADWSVPFIFMGDPAQLPPVGEDESPVWKIPNSVELTQVLRYGNSMLDLATSIRLVVDHPFPSVKIETAPPVYRLMKPQWLSTAFDNLELFKTGDAKIISWRNVVVDEYNHLIRKKIFGVVESREPWLPSDKIVAREPCKDLDDETILHTSEEAEVLESTMVFHPVLTQYECYQLLILTENGRRKNLFSLTPQGQRELDQVLATLQMEAKQPGKGYKWREFWSLKDTFHKVRHSYALTSHMSQGSSYKKVWVDLEDIMRNRNRREAFRSLYVACTRQREELYVA